MSLAQKGRPVSDEAKSNMSKAAKRRTRHGNTGKKNNVVTCPIAENQVDAA